jgi:hypothetical protein
VTGVSGVTGDGPTVVRGLDDSPGARAAEAPAGPLPIGPIA